MFVIGVVLSLLLEAAHWKDNLGKFGVSYDMWMGIDPHLLLFALLPALLTGDAMTIDTCVAKRVANQCLYLAGPGVVFNGFISALFLQVYLGWSFNLSLVVGSILCATDPVAVVALLKELGAAPTLTVQIQGESLLNDGTAIVLYTVAYDMLRGVEYDASEIIKFLVKTACMGWLFGLAVGYAFFLWIRAANNKLEHSSSMIQISLTLCCAYVSFIVAEGVLGMSGVLSTVSASLTLAHNMWPHVTSRETMEHVWHTFEFLGNTVIFFLAGALVGKATVSTPILDYLHLVVIYFVLLFIRGSLIFLSRPILRLLSSENTGPSMRDAAVMTWGGLRGAVGLALAISVHNDRAKDDNGEHRLDEDTAKRVVFFVGGIALLTTVVNATTAPALVNRLGITAMPHAKLALLRYLHLQLANLSERREHPRHVQRALRDMLLETKHHMEEEQLDHSMHAMREDHTGPNGRPASLPVKPVGGRRKNVATPTQLLRGAEHAQDNGDLVVLLTSARENFRLIAEEDLCLLGRIPTLPSGAWTEELMAKIRPLGIDVGMAKVVTETYLKLVRAHYWEQLEQGNLRPGAEETELLMTSVQMAQGWRCDLMDFRFVQRSLGMSAAAGGSMSKLGSAVSVVPGMFASEMPEPPRLHGVAAVVNSMPFSMVMLAAIMLNGVFIALEMRYRLSETDATAWWAVEAIFTTVFTAELVLKLWVKKLRFFYSKWHLFETSLVVMSLISLLFDVSGGVLRIVLMFRALRLLRLIRIPKLFELVVAVVERKSVSDEVARHMMVISAMVSFVHAHLAALADFVKYFGSSARGDFAECEIQNPEVARCLLQSQLSVYRAISMAVKEEQQLHPALLMEVNAERASKRVAEELERFVLDAHRKQVMEKRDAEAILHPLHKHIMRCADIIDECVEGVEVARHERSFSEDPVQMSPKPSGRSNAEDPASMSPRPSGEQRPLRVSECSDCSDVARSEPLAARLGGGQDTLPQHPFAAHNAE